MGAGRRLVASLAPLALLIACGAAAAGGHGSDEADRSRVVLASDPLGSLSIANSLGSGAILSTSALAPGGSTSGQLTITNTSSVPAALTLANTALTDTPGSGGGLLSQRLELEVTDLTAPATVYDGPLALLGTRALRRFEPGEAHVYRFTATLPEGGVPPAALTGDNAYQAASVDSAFVWTATALEGPSGAGGASGTGGAGGAGGTGTGGASGSTASDPPLVLRVRLVRRQPALRKRRLVMKAGCNRPCRFSARARLIGRGARPASTRRARVRSAASNRSVTLSLRLSPKAARRLSSGLRRRGGARLTLAVSARDAQGRSGTFRRELRLKQVRPGGRVHITASWDARTRPRSRTGR